MTAEGLPEYAVAHLAEWLEARGRFADAERAWSVYDRIIYTDRGPAPTETELETLALEVAPGLEYDRARHAWRARPTVTLPPTVVVECCDRRVPLENATRVAVGDGWRHLCRDGMGCTTDLEVHS